ncbi:autotransporter outer membrane beta-barrel domain-containing protein [Herbaspirillum huttiense]|uniref:Autotransporter outer membrane beta-barrel domain-containing protein n=2 Tax=Herbaspirillum huttiense TaxID=863372 RepID=A0AAJ2LTT7_9BURK|nr:autotransporter outer membrane beta-barrel domain-containing protein [Herbaspirillum huttiense]MDR9834948.1 autotransporter outer membrane beta-barrel domain-containing protein [Herbaspirillum huttiense]
MIKQKKQGKRACTLPTVNLRKHGLCAALLLSLGWGPSMPAKAQTAPDTTTPAADSPAPPPSSADIPVATPPALAVPAVDGPSVTAPATDSPAASTPAASTSAASTSAASTPAASTPAASTPAASTSTTSTPTASTPATSTPVASTPVASAPSAASPTATTPSASKSTTTPAAVTTPTAAKPAAAMAPAAAAPVTAAPVTAAPVTAPPAPVVVASPVTMAAAAVAPVAPVLGRQIQRPSGADMTEVVTALGRLPNAASVRRAASQTLPSNLSANAIRGSMASLNRVIATRTDSSKGGSGLSSGETASDRQVWLMPFGSRTNQGDRDGESGFSASTAGLATGADMALESARVGLSFAYAQTSASGNTALAGSGTHSRIESHMLALYGSVPLEALSLTWQADVGHHGNRLSRELQFGGLRRVAGSLYHSWAMHLGSNLSFTLPLNEEMSLVPSLQLDFTRLQSPSYAESGAGDLSLRVQDRRSEALLLGPAARLNFAPTSSSLLSTYVGASYDLINGRDDLVATYAGTPGQSFSMPGPSHSPWLVKAGVSYRFTPVEAAQISLRFDAEGRSGFINQSAAVKASWRF